MENNAEIDGDRPPEFFLRPDVLKEYGLDPVPYQDMGLKANRYGEQVRLR